MRALCLAPAMLLAGCATFGSMETGLTSLVGQPPNSAFERIGYPDGHAKIGEDTVYTWGQQFTVALPTSTSATTTGTVGYTPFQATTSGTEFTPMQMSCSIKIVAGPDNLIKTWSYDGNYGGCETYIQRLKPPKN